MSRFASRAARPTRREEYAGQHQDPSEGHPEGVPAFPDPLPGSHHYAGKDAVPVRHQLDVGPADPYYGTGGMAHGVPAPVQHGGRPAPRPEDRAALEASRAITGEETGRGPDPVPVYIVDMGGGARPLKRAALRQVPVPAPGADPLVLVPRNPHRSSVRVLNESGNPVRILFDLAASGGALLPASMTSYLEVDTEDEICAYQPALVQPATPVVPATTVAQQNLNGFPVTVVITGGTITAVVVNGVTVGTSAGTYAVPAYGAISITYSAPPTWAWSSATSTAGPAAVSVVEQYSVAAGG